MKCCGVRDGNTAAQRAWSNNQRHLLATWRCSLTVGAEGVGHGGAEVCVRVFVCVHPGKPQNPKGTHKQSN